VIFTQQNLISTKFTYFIHAKSTGEFTLTLESVSTQYTQWSQLLAETIVVDIAETQLTKIRTELSLTPNQKMTSLFG